MIHDPGYMASLSPSRQYDVYAAFRGPDFPNYWVAMSPQAPEIIKQLLTFRVRFIVFGENERFGTWEMTQFTSETLQDLQKSIRQCWKESLQANPNARMSFSPRHYLDHLAAAVAATADHPVWGGLANEIVTTLTEAIQ